MLMFFFGVYLYSVNPISWNLWCLHFRNCFVSVSWQVLCKYFVLLLFSRHPQAQWGLPLIIDCQYSLDREGPYPAIESWQIIIKEAETRKGILFRETGQGREKEAPAPPPCHHQLMVLYIYFMCYICVIIFAFTKLKLFP